MKSRLSFVLATVLASAACGGTSYRHPVPGTPDPIPRVDTLPIPEPGESDAGSTPSRLVRQTVLREVGWDLSVSKAVSGVSPAMNVTAFDEVVPSAWYEPRITEGGMSPERLAAGPPAPGPDTTRPLTVIAGKGGGVSPGFTVRDARGNTYLLKFDLPGMPGLASGPDVITSRIFWGAGYHVPKNVIIYFDPEALELAPDAEFDLGSGERSMTREDIGRVLEETDRRPDGRVRALASFFLEGVPRGPFPFAGRRADDPNDYYPHENRRELRGMWVIAAWTNHVDLREENTLDMFVEGKWLKHHVIDFGTTLGSGSIRALGPRDGREYAFDLPAVAYRLASLGFYRRGWEGVNDTPLHPSLGWISSETFDPERWRPYYPNELFRRVTLRDGYWGAKRVAAFGAEHLRAVIAEARYSDPEAGKILLEVLMERRETVLRHWFGQVTPIEDVQVLRTDAGLRIDFRDLGLAEALWSPAGTHYRWSRVGASASGVGGSTSDAGRSSVTIPLDDSFEGDLREATRHKPVLVEISVEREDGTRSRATRIRLHTENGRLQVGAVIH